MSDEEAESKVSDLIARLETSVTNAESRAGDADGYAQNAKSAQTEAEQAQGAIHTLKENADQQAPSIESLATRSSQLEQTLSDQTQRLEQITTQAEKLSEKIEHLLPGAASAGLASAFRERKESFWWPKMVWGVVFVVAIVALVLVAYVNPISFETDAATYGTIIPYVLERLPFIVPIVWLAVYAGRRHSQALRLEEEYAHKESLSMSFEGYKRELLEIEGEGQKDKTLVLIDRVLEALALHAGRVYQGKHEDIHPFGPLNDALRRKEKPKTDAEN